MGRDHGIKGRYGHLGAAVPAYMFETGHGACLVRQAAAQR